MEEFVNSTWNRISCILWLRCPISLTDRRIGWVSANVAISNKLPTFHSHRTRNLRSLKIIQSHWPKSKTSHLTTSSQSTDLNCPRAITATQWEFAREIQTRKCTLTLTQHRENYPAEELCLESCAFSWTPRYLKMQTHNYGLAAQKKKQRVRHPTLNKWAAVHRLSLGRLEPSTLRATSLSFIATCVSVAAHSAVASWRYFAVYVYLFLARPRDAGCLSCP